MFGASLLQFTLEEREKKHAIPDTMVLPRFIRIFIVMILGHAGHVLDNAPGGGGCVLCCGWPSWPNVGNRHSPLVLT